MLTHEQARAEMSAWMDGELPAGLTELRQPVADHVADCGTCRQWRQAAEMVTTRTRKVRTHTSPDRTSELLAAVLAQAGTPKRVRRRFLIQMRAGLAVVAGAQFALLAFPALILGHAGGGAPIHASRELGVFNLALTAAFVLAALRPSLARSMLPLAAISSVALCLLSVVDSALGYTTLATETPHLITLLGSLLLYVLIRAQGDEFKDTPWWSRRRRDAGA